MGVDAMLFAVKAKKCFDFDREYNFQICLWAEEDRLLGIDLAVHNDLVERVAKRQHVSCAAIVRLAENNMKYWAAETIRQKKDYGEGGSDYNYKVQWNEQIKMFALMFPDDMFFVANDHEEPNDWEIRETGGYEMVELPWTT